MPSAVSSPCVIPRPARINENSPICASAAETTSAVLNGNPRRQHDSQRDNRFAKENQRNDPRHLERLAHEDGWVEKHADRDEEKHGKRVLQRQRIRGGLVTQVRLVQHHAREKRTQRVGHAEERRGAKRDSQRQSEHAQCEKLPGSRPRHLAQEPRHDARSHEQHESDKGAHLEKSKQERDEEISPGGISVPMTGSRVSAESLCQRG